PSVELGQAIGAGVGRDDSLRGNDVRLDEALYERFAHVAAPHEADALAFDAHGLTRGGRGPKIAVPTRTIVAPSSTATSKSPLIPMERSGRPSSRPSNAKRRNTGRTSSASSTAGATVIRPRTSR